MGQRGLRHPAGKPGCFLWWGKKAKCIVMCAITTCAHQIHASFLSAWQNRSLALAQCLSWFLTPLSAASSQLSATSSSSMFKLLLVDAAAPPANCSPSTQRAWDGGQRLLRSAGRISRASLSRSWLTRPKKLSSADGPRVSLVLRRGLSPAGWYF